MVPELALTPSLRPPDLAVHHQSDDHPGRITGSELVVEDFFGERVADLPSTFLRIGELRRGKSARSLLGRRCRDRCRTRLGRPLLCRGARGTCGKYGRRPEAHARDGAVQCATTDRHTQSRPSPRIHSANFASPRRSGVVGA